MRSIYSIIRILWNYDDPMTIVKAQGRSTPQPELVSNAALGTQALESRVKQHHAKWRLRIQSLLDAGKLPKIDMETSWPESVVRDEVPSIFPRMDELGIALIAADGEQRRSDGVAGYRWSDYLLEAAEMYPDRFIPATNGGTNPNWLKQKSGEGSFIEKLEEQVRSGRYALIGELDFRHYMPYHPGALRYYKEAGISVGN